MSTSYFSAPEEQEVSGDSTIKKTSKQNYAVLEGNLHSDLKTSKKEKKSKKQLEKKIEEIEEVEEEKSSKKRKKRKLEKKTEGIDEVEVEKSSRKKQLEKKTEKEEEKRRSEEFLVEDEPKELAINDEYDDGISPESNNEEAILSVKEDFEEEDLEEHMLKEATKTKKKSGVCYLSRIPPNMDHVNLRHILSKLAEIKRIYLVPEGPASHANRPNKKSGRFRSRKYTEGWVEFVNKSDAKWVANMLNCQQIGGKRRSQFYYDLWNIKYLSKFKWDDLTEEIAYKNAVREQKLTLEIARAKRERDFYLKKVDQHLALTAIEDRLKKKQKVQDAPKVIRRFPQRKPVTERNKPGLSAEFLAGVFGGGS